MLFAQPIKKISKVFSGPKFDPAKQSKIIPIRHMKFDFETIILDDFFIQHVTFKI